MNNDSKYRLSEQTIMDMKHGVVLYRIITERTFESIEHIIEKGTVGGYVCGYHNLSQDDRCWVDDNAKIFGQAKMLENAFAKGSSMISDDAEISGYSKVIDCAIVRESALVGGEFVIGDNAIIEGNVIVRDHCGVIENATVTGDVRPHDRCIIGSNAYLYGKAGLRGRCEVNGSAIIGGHSCIEESVTVRDKAIIKEHAFIHGRCLTNKSTRIFGYSDISYDVGGLSIINVSLSEKKESIPFLKKNSIESPDIERGGNHRK